MPSTSFPSSRECGRAASDAFSSPLGAKIVTCRCWSRLLERGIRRGAVGVEGGSRMHLECTRWRTHGWSDAHMTSDVGRMLRRKLTRAFCRVSPRDFARRVSSATRARSRTGLTRVTSVPIWARSGPSPSPAALTPRGSFLRRCECSLAPHQPICTIENPALLTIFLGGRDGVEMVPRASQLCRRSRGAESKELWGPTLWHRAFCTFMIYLSWFAHMSLDVNPQWKLD
jgi:hypothetical protein